MEMKTSEIIDVDPSKVHLFEGTRTELETLLCNQPWVKAGESVRFPALNDFGPVKNRVTKYTSPLGDAEFHEGSLIEERGWHVTRLNWKAANRRKLK